MMRKGVSPEDARTVVRTQTTAIAALMVRRSEADALLCGVTGRYPSHLHHLEDLIGLQDGVQTPAALDVLVLKKGAYFVCDTQVNGRTQRRGTGRNHVAGCRTGATVRHRSQGGSHLPLQFWYQPCTKRNKNARDAAVGSGARSRAGNRR